MNISQTIDALRKLAVVGLTEADPDVRGLASLLLHYVEDDDIHSLDETLNIKPARGEAHWKTIRARTIRNKFLLIAAKHLAPSLSPKNMARAIRSEMMSMKPLAHRPIGCPASFHGTIKEPLWDAYQAWPVILSTRHLTNILQENVWGNVRV